MVAAHEIGDELDTSTSLAKESKEESNVKSRSSELVSGHGNMPKIFGNYKVEEKQGANKAAVSSIITTNIEVAEIFFSKMTIIDFPTAVYSYTLSKKSSNTSGKNVLIFDPGGYVQNDQIKCVTKKSNEMISSKVKLDEAVLIISVDGELGHLKNIQLDFLAVDNEHLQLGRKVFIVQLVDSTSKQYQDFQRVSCGWEKC